MKIAYRVTKGVIEAIKNFEWINSNYHIGQIDDYDERELTRLLDNTHYSHIKKILNYINEYGLACGEIGLDLLICNDNFNLSRMLSELYLFAHIQSHAHFSISSIHPTNDTINTDFLITNTKINVYIEVYTPTDFYGYQYFYRNLLSLLKYLPIDLGYTIKIRGDSSNFYHAYDFPREFREIDEWLYQFQDNFIGWVRDSSIGDFYTINSPADTVTLSFLLKEKNRDCENRLIINGKPGSSSDTRLFFESNDIESSSKSQWGNKIFGKLNKQQAGQPKGNNVRILLINFMLSDTADLSFLNEKRYSKNINDLVKYLADKIKPYPPYDIVIPCDLGIECGFAESILLADYEPSFINYIIENSGLNKPIMPVPKASKEEQEQFIKELLDD